MAGESSAWICGVFEADMGTGVAGRGRRRSKPQREIDRSVKQGFGNADEGAGSFHFSNKHGAGLAIGCNAGGGWGDGSWMTSRKRGGEVGRMVG